MTARFNDALCEIWALPAVRAKGPEPAQCRQTHEKPAHRAIKAYWPQKRTITVSDRKLPLIRRARADDVDYIAWTILTAQRGHRSRGYFDIMLARPEPDCLAFARRVSTQAVKSWWHMSYFWIAEVDGEPAAALCALPSAGAMARAREAIVTAVREQVLTQDEALAVMQRGAYAPRCWMPGDDRNRFIEHVATSPGYRGRALITSLLAHALEEGKAAGHAKASITFYIGNEPAERCYAKAGFTFVEERRDPEFEALTGSAGFRRFERAL